MLRKSRRQHPWNLTVTVLSSAASRRPSPDACPPLADAVARDLGRDLYVTLEDGEYDALDACAQAGFAVHRRESYYRIPADPAVTGLAGAVLPAGRQEAPSAPVD